VVAIELSVPYLDPAHSGQYRNEALMEIGSDFRREKGQRDGDRDHSAGSNGSSNISVQVFGTLALFTVQPFILVPHSGTRSSGLVGLCH
jgi:hypothetical protein